MIHYIELIPRWLIICSLLLVPFAQAADDDINIPYTDTYGYVYDPATGSFVKNAPPATTADTATPAAAAVQHAKTPPASVDNQTAVMAEPVSEETGSAADSSPAHTPWVILAITFAGLAIWRLIPRSKPTPVQNPD